MSRLRANQITNENANGAPNFPHGLTVTGVVTATTSATTMSRIVVGSAVTANSQGIDVTGIVTATTVKVGTAISITDSAVSATRFHGDGSQLTGISVDPSATASSDGFLKVLNASTPQIRLSNNASDNDDQQRSFFAIATGNNNFLSGSVANDTVLRARGGGDLVIGVGSTIRMRIDEVGRVTKPNNVSFCVFANGSQNYSSGTVFIPDNPTSTGVCHNIGGHFNVSTGVFTAPIAGRYWLSFDSGVSGTNDAPTDGWSITIQKNGSDSELDGMNFGGLPNGEESHVRADGILNLAASDQIRWQMNGYGGTMVFYQSKFQGYLLG